MDGSHEEKLMTKNLVDLYRVLGNSTTHIALYGFTNLIDSECYFHSLVEHSENIKIINTYAFPIESLIKHSSKNLFYNALRGFDRGGSYRDYPEKKGRRWKELTASERNVLKLLIKNSNTSCKKISFNLSNMNLTPTGVYMIKNRLENQNMVRGYNVNLDYEKLGINIFAFIFLSPKPECLNQELSLIKRCRDSPDIIGCYGLSEEIVIFCGFKNLDELENYCNNILRNKCSDLVKIKHVFIISPRGVIKESFDDLYLSLLED